MKPILINNLEIAKSQEKLTGEINAQDSDRLTEISNPQQLDKLNIHFDLVGDDAKSHVPSMHLRVNATLPLVCQRCLGAMQFDTALAFDYVVSVTEPEEADESDEIDWIESSREMNLTELIEDELLIAIPLAPRHVHNCHPIKLESGEKPNPFAALKGLIK